MKWAVALAVLALAWSAPVTAGTLLALCQGAAEVDVIDTASAVVSARVKVDKVPAGIAISSDGTAAYITHPDIGLLTRLDIKTRTVAATAHIGGQPFGIAAAPDGVVIYVSDWSGDRILRIDARSLAVTSTLAVGRSPAHLAIDPDGRTLYSADRERRRSEHYQHLRLHPHRCRPGPDGRLMRWMPPIRSWWRWRMCGVGILH